MEITPFTMYLFTRLDNVKVLFFLLLMCYVIYTACYLFTSYTYDRSHSHDTDREIRKNLQKRNPLIISILILSFIIFAGIPSQKEAAAIFMVPAIVNNKSMQTAASNVAQSTVNVSEVLLKQSQEWLKDLQTKGEGK